MFNLLKQNLAPKLFALLPLPLWHKLLSIDLIIPHWHIISDEAQPHIIGIYKYRNVKQFKDDIDYFLKFYKPVSLTDIINHLDGYSQLPKHCFLPTFDDGFREIYEIVAPILLKKGIPGAFFLTTSTIDNHTLCYPQKKSIIINQIKDIKNDTILKKIKIILDNSDVVGNDLISQIRNIYYLHRDILGTIAEVLNLNFDAYINDVKPYLSTPQVKELIDKGFDIGAHSMDHPMYSELSIEEQLRQTFESMRKLSESFDYNCCSFAFPYRDFDIKDDFFYKAFANQQLKITFGIGSLINHRYPRNMPRFSMERTDLPAQDILARQFARALFRKH